MIDRDLTVRDLVKQIPGMSQPTISRYTNGVGRNPLIQQAIAEALCVPLDALLAKPTTARATPKRRQKTRNGPAASSSRALAASAKE